MNKKYKFHINIKNISILLVLGASILLTSCGKSQNNEKEKSDKQDIKASFEVSKEDLATARSKFQTEIVDTSFVGDGEPATPPKEIFSLIKYPAKDGDMAAFLTPDPKDGKKHPAVIWLNGGYGGIGNDDFFWTDQPWENDQTGKAFREAGIVTMIPSFRGENNNPGKYEMFYGEISDLESAREYLAKIPYVDPERIYVVGHSTGGTKVLLGNEFSKGFRAAFSLGGIPDLKLRIERGEMMVAIPFNQNNPEEFRLRSPRTFITSLHSPTFYFEGDQYYWSEFYEVQKIADKSNVPFYSYKIKNADHFNIISPVNELIAKKILEDTGEEVNIKFDKADIKWIEDNVRR
ncbi:MAG: prolyl oligopeptidase family serine peptidase [Sebaldella sp.]|nr:prolyl oligopeptidase family serine peptidase [Sebaldella sp.]